MKSPTDQPISNRSDAWLLAMAELYADVDEYQAEATTKNTQRWSGQTCERVAQVFVLMGYTGFSCEVEADGSLRFTGVSAMVPAYLRCDEDACEPELLRAGGVL